MHPKSRQLSQQKAQQKMMEAYQHIQNAQFRDALPILNALLRKVPNNSDLLHLTAMAYKGEGELKLAEKFFNRCLTINKHQPQVLNNLANLYKEHQYLVKAENHYLKALTLKNDFFEARRNLALCLYEQKKYQGAIRELELLITEDQNDVVALSALASCYRELSDFQAAHDFYERALALNPKRVLTLINQGVCFHLEGQLEKALVRYEQGYQQAPLLVEIISSFGSALSEIGDTQRALQVLKEGINQHPTSIALHEIYNQTLWSAGELSEFGESYSKPIHDHPKNIDLQNSFIGLMIKAGNLQAARNQIDTSLKKFPKDPVLLGHSGSVHAELGEAKRAETDFKLSIKSKFDNGVTHQLVKLLLIQERYSEAQQQLDKLIKLDQDCQLNWAFQSLLWRLTNDHKYQWLNQYDRFVRSFELPKPQGYESLEAYLERLAVVLRKAHRAEREPLLQTLRNGTQTAPRLLHSPTPEIQELKLSIEQIVANYVHDLDDDNDHPFLKRKSEQFQISGSWSVELKPKGFHINHVHPQGWLSSSCYIDIPNSVVGSANNEGAIKFGESPLDLGEREVIEKIILPKPGMVVLFPSYMWHGTIAFESAGEETRLTAPFDVIPL